MAEPALDRRQPDLAQLLLREGDEALQRARALLSLGPSADPILLAQELHAAGAAFVQAAAQIALRERRRRRAA